MRYYLERTRGPSGRKRSEGRIIVETEDGRNYGLHTSFPDGFTCLDGGHLPRNYLQEWCKPTTEKQERRIMPGLFRFLEKYGITDRSAGTYPKAGEQ